jgi:tetratricopeptide (TPR) repeat protein
MANLHNLLGVTFHRQSKFADAVVQFTKALKINKNYIESGLNLAATFCDLGKYDDAKAVFNEINSLTPTNKRQPDLIYGRLANQHAECGKLYEQSGLISEAMSEYKRALALFERMPDVRLSLGKLLFRNGQIDRAVIEFQTVCNQFPDEHEAYLWSGISNWKKGNSDLARRQWQTAVSLQGGHSVAAAYLRFLENAVEYHESMGS